MARPTFIVFLALAMLVATVPAMENSNIDTSADGEGSDLAPQQAQPDGPTGGPGLAWTKGATGVGATAGTGATGQGAATGAAGVLAGGRVAKQLLSLEGITKGEVDEKKVGVEKAIAAVLKVEDGAVQVTSVEENTPAVDAPTRRRLLARNGVQLQYVVRMSEAQSKAVFDRMQDTDGLAQNLAPGIAKALGAEVAAFRLTAQAPAENASVKDDSEDTSDGDISVAPVLDSAPTDFKPELPALPCPNDCSGNGYCRNGKCECKQGFTGLDCHIGSCAGTCSGKDSHGQCGGSKEFFQCKCAPGWTGSDCTVSWCPNDCSKNGICVQEHGKNRCYCRSGWGGDDCSTATCPNECSGHGDCVNMKCKCAKGFMGEDCSEKYCLNDCSGHGLCNDGKCMCEPRFEGEDCSIGICPTAVKDTVCSGHGACNNGTCSCAAGYIGEDCMKDECPQGCVYGNCMGGKCVCKRGFRGVDCSIKGCPDHCGANGYCHEGTCFCKPGFSGENCRQLTCGPSKCNGHGKCRGGVCECEAPWSGYDCSYRSCAHLKNCNLNGFCRAGKCICHARYSGVDCGVRLCPHNCNGNAGTCDDGVCICNEGWGGPYCTTRKCVGGCANGRCDNGVCICKPGWSGQHCDKQECPANCNDNGLCINGVCACKPDWTGTSCSQRLCPGMCHGNGICQQEDATCQCFDEFAGPDCKYRKCPTKVENTTCSGSGKCFDGNCTCLPGYTGLACEIAPCAKECELHGRCEAGKCICRDGWGGANCTKRTCTGDCSHHGICQPDLTCKCFRDWEGDNCELRKCHSNCSNHGHCFNGTCYCLGDYTGQQCQTKVCKNQCSGHGNCMEGGACACRRGWSGEDCSRAKCPSKSQFADCTGHGVCIQHAHPVDRNGTAQTKSVPKCFCSAGWTGSSCHLKTCSKQCETSPNSDCHDGVCYCKQGFGGDFCTQTLCLKDCHGHGVCGGNGTCQCHTGWRGDACQIETCDDRCEKELDGVTTGVCSNDKCKCKPGYRGADCKQKTCAYECNEPNGYCNGADGECYCKSGFGGVDCSIELIGCPNLCGGKGKCVGSPKRCSCDEGWEGIACEIKQCPNKCSGNGDCAPGTLGQCNCKPGWYGEDCSCGHACMNGGKCVTGICHCAHGFRGVNCTHTICPKDCSQRGECVLADQERFGTTEASCKCSEGFEGDACDIRRCPNDCHNTESEERGLCQAGVCICKTHFAGDDCALHVGKNGAGRGPISAESLVAAFHNYRYVKDKMVKQPRSLVLSEDLDFLRRLVDARSNDLSKAIISGNVYNPSFVNPAKVESTVKRMFAEDLKERASLVVAATGNSTAKMQADQHRATWRRYALDILAMGGNSRVPCPHGCSGRGKCVHGLCVCKEGWHTADCSERSCPRNCSGNGVCNDGVCECANKWSGPYCSVSLTPKCEKTCLAQCQKGVAEGDDGANSRQACLRDCIKKNCHAKRFGVRGLPPMETIHDRIYAQQQMNRVEGRTNRNGLPVSHGEPSNR